MSSTGRRMKSKRTRSRKASGQGPPKRRKTLSKKAQTGASRGGGKPKRGRGRGNKGAGVGPRRAKPNPNQEKHVRAASARAKKNSKKERIKIKPSKSKIEFDEESSDDPDDLLSSYDSMQSKDESEEEYSKRPHYAYEQNKKTSSPPPAKKMKDRKRKKKEEQIKTMEDLIIATEVYMESITPGMDSIDTMKLDEDVSVDLLKKMFSTFPNQYLPIPHLDTMDSWKVNLFLHQEVAKETSHIKAAKEEKHIHSNDVNTGTSLQKKAKISEEIQIILQTPHQDKIVLTTLVCQARLAIAKLILKDETYSVNQQQCRWTNEYINIHSQRQGGEFMRYFRHFALIALLNKQKANAILKKSYKQLDEKNENSECPPLKKSITNLKSMILNNSKEEFQKLRPTFRKSKKKFIKNLKNIFSTLF